MLIDNMDLYHLMTYAEQLEGEKHKKKKRNGESKKAFFEGGFQNSKSGRFPQGQKFQGQGYSSAPNKRFGNDNLRFPKMVVVWCITLYAKGVVRTIMAHV
ncbi:MAG: hypothetical protein Q8830_02950 [Candidatus Phytoplasma australasiaticum]|nr:hypothetical protein [Candidatus Phytoplasma australasiaticum]